MFEIKYTEEGIKYTEDDIDDLTDEEIDDFDIAEDIAEGKNEPIDRMVRKDRFDA